LLERSVVVLARCRIAVDLALEALHVFRERDEVEPGRLAQVAELLLFELSSLEASVTGEPEKRQHGKRRPG